MGCRQYGAADTSKFGVVMPWVGLYVALASFALFVLISMDIVGSLRMRKRWISPRWLTLNSATLTILGVAAKLPSDINTPMPGLWDQLTKLSGLVLVCVVITHAMPSTFDMEGTSTVLSNMVALGILVVTLFVNMWIQMQTGVVVEFVGWCQVYSLLMLFLFVLAVSNCLVSIPVRGAAESGTLRSLKKIVGRELADKHVCDPLSIRACIAACWKRALICSPGNPYNADSTVLVSTIITATATITFMVTVATRSIHGRVQCYMTSDYGWSNAVILFIQLAAILAGAVSCLFRIMAYLLQNADRKILMGTMGSLVLYTFFSYENLLEWIAYLSPYPLRRILTAKTVRRIRTITSVLCALLLSAVAWPVVSILLLFLLVAKQSVKLMMSTDANDAPGQNRADTVGASPSAPLNPQSRVTERSPQSIIPRHRELPPIPNPASPSAPPNPRRSLVQVLMKLSNERDDHITNAYDLNAEHHVQKWFAIGKNSRPHDLLGFLQQNSTPSRKGFPLVKLTRYCHNIAESCMPRGQSSFSSKYTPGCWSLAIASLATMARATTPHDQLPDLMKAVEEAFPFALFVDRNFQAESKGSRIPILAARVTWDALKIDDTWQQCNMRTEAATFRHSPVKMIQRLLERARQVFFHRYVEVGTAPAEITLDMVICKCMYAISSNILRVGLDHPPISDSSSSSSSTTTTRETSNLRPDSHPRMILADVIGACILNLPRALLETCYRAKPGTMDRKARDAAFMLGQLEDVLLWLKGELDPQHYKANGSFKYLNFWGKHGYFPPLTKPR